MQFKEQQRLSALKKHCSKSHFELVKFNNGADDYCNKEDTRVEGPWSFGIKPAKLNVKGDLKRRNEELIAMGAEKAVADGLVPISNYLALKKNIDAYKLSSQFSYSHPTVRGLWIWGPPGVGKSMFARNMEPAADIYLKQQNKWFDGYTGQPTILLEDHDSPCLGHFLKIWADSYSCSGESKGGTVPLLHRKFVVTANYSIARLYEKDGPEMIAAIQRRFEERFMDHPQPAPL